MRRSPSHLSIHLLPLVLVLLAALAAAHIDRRLANAPALDARSQVVQGAPQVPPHKPLAPRASGFLADELEGAADAAATLARAHVSLGEGAAATRRAGRKREVGRQGHDWEVMRKRVELDGRQRGLIE